MKSEAVVHRYNEGTAQQKAILFGPSVKQRSVSRSIAAIPCYNEALSVGSVVLKARRYVDEVLVIDDGSTDDTRAIAHEAGAVVITHQKNAGKGAAVKTALEYARVRGFEYLVLLDGDGQHDPDEIPRLLTPVKEGNADMVIGSRFLDNTRSTIPFYRRIGQQVLTTMTNMDSSIKTTDSQSGFRVLGRSAIQRFTLDSEGYSVESDMISTLSENGAKIYEVPISVNYDVPNKHKKHPVTHGFGVLNTIIRNISFKHPVMTFGSFGGAFLFLGSASWYVAATAPLPQPIGHSMVGLLFITGGLLLLSLGVIISYLAYMFKGRETRG
ncbi:glycosyltransferase involved in cell wall biosynthesis [Methanofollis sp. W23]|uniref:glycosyltransferase family 2 protein n=1 Tax=Methanofollis sp. W23 TaxID=2817849 RepID=UPI001AE18CAC|nr:glycosyltransferase involved in cell wall biosynthesis [Methanofollis sp. W23]